MNSYVIAIKQFAAENWLKVSDEEWKKMRRRLMVPAREVTIDEAGIARRRKILSHMDVRGRSPFLFLLSSGCRI